MKSSKRMGRTTGESDAVRVDSQILENLRGLLRSGELLAEDEFLARTGLNLDYVQQALRGGLFYIEVEGINAYPAFFADTRYSRECLMLVSLALGEMSSGSKFLFFRQQKGSLAIPAVDDGQESGVARTPLEALEDGAIDAVMRAAVGFSQR